MGFLKKKIRDQIFPAIIGILRTILTHSLAKYYYFAITPSSVNISAIKFYTLCNFQPDYMLNVCFLPNKPSKSHKKYRFLNLLQTSVCHVLAYNSDHDEFWRKFRPHCREWAWSLPSLLIVYNNSLIEIDYTSRFHWLNK